MNLYGNHDWEPYKWGDGSFGYHSIAGELQMQASRNRIKEAARKSGINLFYLGGALSGWGDPMPFAFTYRGVKYYCGNSFWFLPFYKTWTIPHLQWPTFRPVDTRIAELEKMVNRDTGYPVIWMQHYPLSDNHWWDQFQFGGLYNGAESRQNKIKDLIFQTKNPAFFAGHYHFSQVNRYSNGLGKTFTEYVTPYFREGGGSGYFALVSEKEGVLTAEEFSADALLR